MDAVRLGYLARRLRVELRIRQRDLGDRTGVGRAAVSRLERGLAGMLKLQQVEAILGGLGARVDWRVLWNGPELDRMLDAGHSAIAALVMDRLREWGWIVKVEVSYSRYGERGRIDLLAWHPELRIVLVVEIKTDLVDTQSLLGTLDAKARLVPHIVADFGWEVRAIVPAIVFAEDRTTRSRLARLDTLFDRYSLRGRAALAWIRRPTEPAPSGLLWFVAVPEVTSRASRPRVRGASAHDDGGRRPGG